MYKLPPLDDASTTATDFAAPTPPQLMARTRSKRARSRAASAASAGGADADGDAYFQRLVAEQIQADISEENPPSEAEDKILDDDDSLNVRTVDSSDGNESSAGSSVHEKHDPDDIALGNVSETKIEDVAPREEIDIAKGEEEENNPPPPALPEVDLLDLEADDVADLPSVKKGRSSTTTSSRRRLCFSPLIWRPGGGSVASSSSLAKSFLPKSPGTGRGSPKTLCPRLYARGPSTIPKQFLMVRYSTHMSTQERMLFGRLMQLR